MSGNKNSTQVLKTKNMNIEEQNSVINQIDDEMTQAIDESIW